MKRKLITTLVVLGWAASSFFVCKAIWEVERSYRVDHVFYTIEDYEEFSSDFKTRVLAGEITIGEYTLVASDPPIIVKARFSAPKGYDWDYKEISLDGALIFSMFPVVGIITLFAWIILTDPTKDSKKVKNEEDS